MDVCLFIVLFICSDTTFFSQAPNQTSDGKQNWKGNVNSGRPNKHHFGVPVVANAVRIYPKDKKSVNMMRLEKDFCLRVELYGCPRMGEFVNNLMIIS